MANCNYKVNIKDIQSKYSFKIFCAGDNAEVKAEIGNLEDLTTTAKNNLVSAINEVHSDTETNATAISGLQSSKEDKSNKVTSFSSTSTDTQYPSAKAVYDSQVTQDETISTLETNLEETQKELDYYKTIYNVLPKVEGNGDSITLNNTGESILKLDPRGQCKQDKTNGNNLIDTRGGTTTTINGITFTPTYNSKGELQSIKVNGTATDRADFIFPNYLTLQAGTYYLSKQSSNSVYLLIVDSGGSSYATSSLSESEFTLSADKSVRLWLRVFSGVSIDNAILYPMVSKTSGATYEPFTFGASPNPSYPQQIHEVSGDNDIKVCGKNLLNYIDNLRTSYSGLNSVINEDGSITTTGLPTSDYRCIVEYNINDILENGQTYIFWQETAQAHLLYMQVNAIKKDGSGTSYYSLNTGDAYKTFVADTDTYNYLMNIQTENTSSWGGSSKTITNKYMLEKSNTKTSFEPYNGDTYELDLGVENLFDKNGTLTNGYLKADGTTQSASGYKVSDYINISQFSDITISGNDGGNEVNCFYDSSKAFVSYFSMGSSKTITKVVPSNAKYMRCTIKEANLDIYQLEKGTKANSYSPFGQEPIKMRGIGTYDDYFTKNSGKNLVDLSGIGTQSSNGITITDNNDGTYTLNGTATANTIFSKSINTILQAGTYAYSLNNNAIVGNSGSSSVYCYVLANETGTNWLFDRYSYQATDSYNTGTINQNYTLNTFRIVIPNGVTLNNLRIGYMIEKGSSKSPYEPYGTGQWCKYNAIGEVDLGTIDWYYQGGRFYTYAYADYIVKNPDGTTIANVFCYKYTAISPATWYAKTTKGISIGIIGYAGESNILVYDSDYTSAASFKTAMSGNTLYFQRKTPYLSLVENEKLISQLDIVEKALAKQEQTNISQVNNDIPFKIYASALKEIE